MSSESSIPYRCELSGGDIQITYVGPLNTSANVGAEQSFVYQDQHQRLELRGESIRNVDTDLGLIVSVTIGQTIDSGSTSFSLLLPRMNVPGETTVPVDTQGITTIHRFATGPALNQGQLDFYTVTQLSGAVSRNLPRHNP
jgi:hypothetical protein